MTGWRESKAASDGEVVAVRGNVVDVRFPPPVPARDQELRAGADGRYVLEVQIHLGTDALRCIALTSTRGLGRGMAVTAIGTTLEMPVGDSLLGRMLNVFGEPVDGDEPPRCEERWSIHRPPLPLQERATSGVTQKFMF